MGKEAKIGLAVILVLLITFAVVLTRRLGGSGDTPTAPASVEKRKSKSEAQDDRVGKDGKAQASGAGFSKPTVVEAEALSSDTPKLSPGDVGQWRAGPGGSTTQRGPGTGAAGPSLPSFFANPPKAALADPFGPYGRNTQQSTPRSQTWRDDRTDTSSSTGAGGPSDPFYSRNTRTPTTDTSQGLQGPHTLRVIPPPGRSSQGSTDSSYPYSDPGRNSTAGSTIGQTPSSRESSRYPYPTPPESPTTTRRITVSDSDSSIGSKFGSGNFLRRNDQYEVQPNDSYWVISEKLYGSGAYFKALAEHNRDKIPREDRLAVGDVISAPSVTELEQTYPGLCPKPSRRQTIRNRASAVSTRSPYLGGRTYVVHEGDTLFDIARYELGKASRWVEIHELNRDLLGPDPDYLVPGIELVLPDDDSSDTITIRPGTDPTFKR